MIASFEVDGHPEAPSTLGLPAMSLSSARSTMTRHECVFHVLKVELIRLLSATYADWVTEFKRDDAQCGSPQDELAAAGYPPLEQIANDADLSQVVFGTYLLQEMFEGLRPDASPTIEFWLDTVHACVVVGDFVAFHGVCYR